MGLSNAILDAAGAAIAAGVTHVGLASADPGSAGTNNNTSAARVAVSWGSITTGGDFANSADLNFTGGAASGAVGYVTLWSGATGGTFQGSKAVTGDNAFNAAGQYQIPAGSLTITGTSTT